MHGPMVPWFLCTSYATSSRFHALSLGHPLSCPPVTVLHPEKTIPHPCIFDATAALLPAAAVYRHSALRPAGLRRNLPGLITAWCAAFVLRFGVVYSRFEIAAYNAALVYA